VSNPLKYVTSTPTGTLRHANLGAGVSSIQYDETFNSGLNPSDLTTYYLVYEPVEGAAVRIYAPANAAELIQLAQSKGSTETTEAGALSWLSDNNYYPANKVLDSIVTDNLVFYTDATTSTSYPRSGTAWLDLSGEGDDLTGTGTSSSPTFDSTNSSLSFDGNAQRFQSSTDCGVVGDQTLEAVFYEDAATAPHTTVICTDTGYQYGIKLMSFKNSNRYGFWLGYGNSNHLGMISETLDNDVVYHLLGTYKASTGEVKIYLNGVLKMTDTMPTTGNVSLNEGKITLGIDYHGLGTGYSMNGNIFSSRVYDKVLTQDEVNQNYYQGTIPTTSLATATDIGNPVGHLDSTTLIDLISTATDFTTESTEEGSVTYDSSYGGVLNLNAGRIYKPTLGWYGKFCSSWWQKMDSPPGSTLIFYTENFRGAGGCYRISSYITTSGTFGFRVWDNSSYSAGLGGTHIVTSTTNICDGDWHQTTLQWSNGSGNQTRGLYIYVDGVQEDYTDIIGNDGGYQHWHLGGSFGCVGDNTSTCLIGPVQFYKNYNLTNDEVVQNYNAYVKRFN